MRLDRQGQGQSNQQWQMEQGGFMAPPSSEAWA